MKFLFSFLFKSIHRAQQPRRGRPSNVFRRFDPR